MQFAEMNAKSVAALLSGTPKGNHWVAPCPHCQPEGRGYQFGLRISDTAHGCDFLCIHGKCSTFDILRSAGLAVSFSDAQAILFEVEAHKQRGSEANQLEDRKSFRRNSVPISGTLGEQYFRSVGITCDLPVEMRFVPECPSAEPAIDNPAILTPFKTGNGVQISELFETETNGFEIEHGEPLGTFDGAAISLSENDGPLLIGVGIEDGLSLLSGLLSRPHEVWVVPTQPLLRTVNLPVQPRELVIAVPGNQQARFVAKALERRARLLGWKVSLMVAPDGKTWNDVLRERTS